jgi:general secretion pathway protein H
VRTICKDEGFTFIEMLVVLGLMAVLISISLPYSTTSGEARELDTFSQFVTLKLRETRYSAIWANKERKIIFDLKKGLVAQTEPERIYPLPKGSSFKIVTAENEVIADFAAIRFFPDGGSTGGKITIFKGNTKREVAINWLTGAIVMSDGNAP